MEVRVYGQPTVTVNGSNYSVDVYVCFYDNEGWRGEGTNLTITGPLTDTGAAFMTKLRAASDAWQADIAIRNTFQSKLNGIVGKVL